MKSEMEHGRRAQIKVKELLSDRYYIFYKGVSTPGTDIVAVKEENGMALTFFVEVKATKGNLITMRQKQVNAMMRDRNRYIERVHDSRTALVCICNFCNRGWKAINLCDRNSANENFKIRLHDSNRLMKASELLPFFERLEKEIRTGGYLWSNLHAKSFSELQ